MRGGLEKRSVGRKTGREVRLFLEELRKREQRERKWGRGRKRNHSSSSDETSACHWKLPAISFLLVVSRPSWRLETEPSGMQGGVDKPECELQLYGPVPRRQASET